MERNVLFCLNEITIETHLLKHAKVLLNKEVQI